MPSPRRRSNITLSKGQLSLRGQLVPYDPRNLTDEDKMAISSALSTLHNIAQDIKRYHEQGLHQAISARFIDTYWECGLLDWFTYLFEHYHPRDDSRWDVISHVSSVLEYFLDKKPDIIRDDEDGRCFELIVRLWFETAFDHLKADSSVSRGWWGPFLTMAHQGYGPRFPAGDITKESILSRLAHLKGIPTVNTILQRFKYISKIPTTRPMEYVHLVTALNYFVLEDRIIGKPLNGVIRRMADMLHHLVYSVLPSEPLLLFDSCLKLICLIAEKIDNGHSINAVLAALSGRYYQSIAVFSPYFDKMGRKKQLKTMDLSPIDNRFREIFSDSIMKYACYYSVRTALYPIFNDDDCSEKVKGTTLQEHWERLREANRRLMSISIAKTEENFSMSMCDNPLHGQKPATDKLSRCSGCETAWYCSKECQQEHWRFDHREMCGELRSLAITTTTEEKLRMRDFRSVMRRTIPFGVIELMKNAENIARKNPNVAIVYDHTAIPWNISLVNRDAVSQKLASVIPNASIVQCRIPLGTRVAMLTAVGNLQEAETTVWFAGQSYTTYVPIIRQKGDLSEQPAITTENLITAGNLLEAHN